MCKLLRGIKGVLVYIRGQYFAIRYYDKKYLTGKWFEGKFLGILSQGWQWVVKDAIGSKKMGNISQAPWPVDPRTSIVHYSNIVFDINDLHIFQNPGCYFQAHEKIIIGKGCWIAPNVGLITSNHNVYDLEKHDIAKPIVLGNNCWIGMNSMILPGVTLGDHTIVGAGSVVTKSFKNGNCVICGNPAKIIRRLNLEVNERE